MWVGGLYYPYMRVRNPNWLKASILYWDSIRRFCPAGYRLRESQVDSQLTEAGFLKNVNPEFYSADISNELLAFMQENIEFLRNRFSVNAALVDSTSGPGWGTDGPRYGDKRLGWVHSRKMSNEFSGFLAGEGLAEIGRGGDSQWVGLHPVVAAAYMLALVSECAHREQLEPVTDNPSPLLSPAQGVRAAIRLLTSASVGLRLEESRYDAAGFAVLAIESVMPKDLNGISVDRIIEVKNKLQEELTLFRGLVESQQPELERLASIGSDDIYTEAFAAHVSSTIKGPLARLERGFKLNNWDTIRSVLTMQTITPPTLTSVVSSSAHVPPTMIAIEGVGVAIGSAWWQLVEQRKQLIRQSPVGYLLSINKALSARTIIGRRARLLSDAG